MRVESAEKEKGGSIITVKALLVRSRDSREGGREFLSFWFQGNGAREKEGGLGIMDGLLLALLFWGECGSGEVLGFFGP